MTKSLKPMLPGSIIIVKIYIFSESSFDGLSIDIYLAVSCSTEKLHPGVLFGFSGGVCVLDIKYNLANFYF